MTNIVTLTTRLLGIEHTDPVVNFTIYMFDLLILLMISAFLLTAAILIFNRFYDSFYDKHYKALMNFVVRHIVDEDEVVPPPDVLTRNIMRNVIIDLLFITKGPGVETLKALYVRFGFYTHDISLLKHRAWHKRLAAIVRLDQWKDLLSHDDLVFLMDDENKDVRTHAVKALSSSDKPEIAENVLEHLLKGRMDLSIRYECLVRLLVNHRELILSDLRDPAWRELAPHIIKVLGDKRDISSVPAIMDAAAEEDANIRENAYTSLGKIGDPRGISLLIAGLEEGGPRERLAALKSLFLIDEDLFRKYQETLLADTDPLVRGWTQHLLRGASV